MNEELRNELDNEEEVMPVVTTEESSGNGFIKFVLVTAGAVGGVILWIKSKDKRRQRMIKKLTKEGYVVVAPTDDQDEESCEEAE